jgi:signal transduction histidine kinase
MQSAEELQEILSALQRENQRIRLEISHANLLLKAFASLLTVGRGDDPFANVFESLRNVFSFDCALMLVESHNGQLDCIAATPASFLGRQFSVGHLPPKVLQRRVAITFAQAGGFADLPELRNRAGLYLPIEVRLGRGCLVLFGAQGASGFNRSDIPLAEKFSLLVGHALETQQSNQQIMESETRARVAEQASSMKNMLIANMSHEFRTPLNAILGFSELMRNSRGPNALTPANLEYVQHIHAGGQHLLSIVNNLLLLAKIGAGEHKPRIETIDLAAELTWVLKLLGGEAERTGVILQVEPIDGPIQILADTQSVRQILLNIIGNAIKFSPQGAAVEIYLRRPAGGAREGAVSLVVRDRGPGIPQATLAELGKPFIQADDAFTRRNQGSGLGLAISYGLAQAMAATISIKSEMGTGTIVEIAFKVMAQHSADVTVR